MSQLDEAPRPETYTVIQPSAEIVKAVTNVEYSIEAAIADIVDNSIDAGASYVLVRIVGTPSKVGHLVIADNGRGMTATTLTQAMTFARRRKYAKGELGLYGMGLKSASLSQCEVLTVCSKAARHKPVGRQWTVSSAADGWKCGIIDQASAAATTSQNWPTDLDLTRHGTVVRWDGTKYFRHTGNRVDEYVKKLFEGLSTHLGLVMHRLLSRGKLRIALDFYNADADVVGLSTQVLPLDPFGYAQSGAAMFPTTFEVPYNDSIVRVEAHVWPKSTRRDANFRLTGTIAERQGFYFYRNDRLVQAGGWNGLRVNSEPHLSLARVAIDMPSDFPVRFTKASIQVPAGFLDSLNKATDLHDRTFAEYLATAQQVYRTRGKQTVSPVHPVRGLIPAASKVAKAELGFTPDTQFTVRIGRVTKGHLFTLNVEKQQLILNKSLLDSASPNQLKEALKVVTYLLLQEDFKTERLSEKKRKTLEVYSRMGGQPFARGG